YMADKITWFAKYQTILHRSKGDGKTFLYHIDLPPSNDVPEYYDHGRKLCKIPHRDGMAHAEELPLLFKTQIARRFQEGDDHYNSWRKFINIFANFIKTGNPNNEGQQWDPIPKNDMNNLICYEMNTANTWHMSQLENDKFYGPLLLSPFLPRIEKYDNANRFLPESLKKLSENAWSQDIDVMIGGCSNEGLFYYLCDPTDDDLKKVDDDNSLLLPLDLQKGVDSGKKFEKGKLLKEIYFGKDGTISKEKANEYCRLSPSKPLPVLIFIHGGAFINGSSSTTIYGPDYLIENNIIMVSFNYRLNIYGFLSFDDTNLNIPGNAGLKDQNLALKWIKNNIEAFGGDSNNITLCGQSAGGASVNYHLISPLSRNLFNRAIIMAGSAFCPWASIPLDFEVYMKRLVQKLGLKGDESDEIIFRAICESDPEELLRSTLSIVNFEMNISNPIIVTKLGPIKGRKKVTDINVEYYSFQNIPYIKTFEGDRLFKDPEIVEPWTEILDCTSEGPAFFNIDPFRSEENLCEGSLKSLGINIFTPN
uniref:Carboxylic ester hydrolase n=1 Tax=Culicoides sonorensis TaxID=179676 RepID=A0A336L2V1_CULSO